MRNGRGQVGVAHRLHLAHRVAWTLEHGPLTGDAFVFQRCGLPSCCNPRHLALRPREEHLQAIGAYAATHEWPRAHGERASTAKLTERDVREIWRLHREEGLGQRRLGARFRVTPENIRSILRRATWRHVDLPK